MAAIGMIAAAPQPAKKQLLFKVTSRYEVNPSVGGFLQSHFTRRRISGAASRKAPSSARSSICTVSK